MTRYPLLLGFRDLIAGNGYVAGVALAGRALLVDEDDGFWMYGVNPGGIAAGGKTHSEAQAEFRQGYKSVLFDLAAQASDFADFRRQALAFFEETNEPTEREWLEAVAEVRKGNVAADWLPTKPVDSCRLGMEVAPLEAFDSGLNAMDQAQLAA